MGFDNYSLLRNFDRYNYTRTTKEEAMKYVHILLYRLYGRIPYKHNKGFDKYLENLKSKNKELQKARLLQFLKAN